MTVQKVAYLDDIAVLYAGAKQFLVLAIILFLLQFSGVLSQVHNTTNVLSTPLSLLTSTLFLVPARSLRSSNTNLSPSVPGSAQPLLPAVSASLLPQYGTHPFALVHHHHTHSVVFLKLTASSGPSVPPSGSHECLRFGLWLTLRTIRVLSYSFYIDHYCQRHISQYVANAVTALPWLHEITKIQAFCVLFAGWVDGVRSMCGAVDNYILANLLPGAFSETLACIKVVFNQTKCCDKELLTVASYRRDDGYVKTETDSAPRCDRTFPSLRNNVRVLYVRYRKKITYVRSHLVSYHHHIIS